MSIQTIRTLSQLLDLLPDNVTRLISPQQTRDMAVTAWPALLGGDPTPYDDNVNTGGNGFFDLGSRAINTADKSWWLCQDGTPFTAVWVKVYPTIESLRLKVARLNGAIGDVVPLGFTGLTGDTLTNDSRITGIVPAISQSMNSFNWFAYFTTTFLDGQIVPGNLADDAFMDNDANSSGNITFDAYPRGFEAVEQTIDPVTGTLVDAASPILWDLTTRILFPASQAFVGVTGFVEAIFLGIASGLEIWLYYPIPTPNSNLTVGGPFIQGDVVTNYGGNSAYNVIVNWNQFTIINWLGTPVFYGPTINPSILPPGVPRELKYVVNGSAFSGAAPQTLHIDTYPAKTQIIQVTYNVTVAWNGSFGPPGSMQLGYSAGGGGTTQLAEFGTIITLGTVNSQIVGGYDNAYAPNLTGSWFLDVTIPGYGGSLTGLTGSIEIHVVFIQLS